MVFGNSNILVAISVIFAAVGDIVEPSQIHGDGIDGMHHFQFPYVSTAIVSACNVSRDAARAWPHIPSLVFAKTHKTGGSTVASIVNRIVGWRSVSQSTNIFSLWISQAKAIQAFMHNKNATFAVCLEES
jgi:hypothetical protein